MAPPITTLTNRRLACLAAAGAALLVGGCGGAQRDHPTPSPAKPDDVIHIVESHDKVRGGVQTFQVPYGHRIQVVVDSDYRYLVHILGFNLKRITAPGRPARFVFVANQVGHFQVESHGAVHAGHEPSLAWLSVETGVKRLSSHPTPQCSPLPVASPDESNADEACHG